MHLLIKRSFLTESHGNQFGIMEEWVQAESRLNGIERSIGGNYERRTFLPHGR